MIKTLKKFDSISLSEMDSKMWSIGLERMEKKYVIHNSLLEPLLKELQEDYVALEIKWLREFEYRNMYFDTPEYKFFHDHGKWYKLRTKLRTRKYVDSDLAFFEFKQRYYETIRKFKFEIKPSKHGIFSQKMKTFSNKLFQSIYQKKMGEKIVPSMKTQYVRFTLCSKLNDERITFDTKVTFQDPRSKKSRPYTLSDIVLVESKSGNTTHHAESILNKYHIKPLSGISKYCLWVLLQWVVTTKYKNFENLLKHIHSLQTTS